MPLSHCTRLHLDLSLVPGTLTVDHLLGLPEHHAAGQEQEEAREKHAEEDEEVDVRLVLAEVDDSIRRVGGSGDDQVEPRHLQLVRGVRQHYHQPVAHPTHYEQRVWVRHRHKRHQSRRMLLGQLVDGVVGRGGGGGVVGGVASVAGGGLDKAEGGVDGDVVDAGVGVDAHGEDVVKRRKVQVHI